MEINAIATIVEGLASEPSRVDAANVTTVAQRS